MPKFNYQKAKGQMAPEDVRAYLDAHRNVTMSAADSVALRKDLMASKNRASKSGPGWDAARGFVASLPAQGGIAGGTAGAALGLEAGGIGAGPGAMGGAVLGGSIGKVGRNILGPMVGLEDQGMNPADIVAEGGKQGTLFGLGLVGGKGAELGGRALLEAAVPGITPDVAKAMMAERITTTRWGLSRLTSRIEQAAAKVKGMRAQAEASGNFKWDPAQMMGEVYQKMVPEILKKTTSKQQAMALMNETLDMLNTRVLHAQRTGQWEIGPEAMNEIRGFSDDIANPIHKAIAKAAAGAGPPVDPLMTARAAVHKEVADAARQRLNTIGLDPVTKEAPYAEANGRLSQLMDVRDAIAPRSRMGIRGRLAQSSIGASAGALLPGDPMARATHALLGAAVTQPEVTSTAAMLLDPYIANLMRNAPQVMGGMASVMSDR